MKRILGWIWKKKFWILKWMAIIYMVAGALTICYDIYDADTDGRIQFHALELYPEQTMSEQVIRFVLRPIMVWFANQKLTHGIPGLNDWVPTNDLKFDPDLAVIAEGDSTAPERDTLLEKLKVSLGAWSTMVVVEPEIELLPWQVWYYAYWSGDEWQWSERSRIGIPGRAGVLIGPGRIAITAYRLVGDTWTQIKLLKVKRTTRDDESYPSAPLL